MPWLKDQHTIWSWGNVKLFGEPSLCSFCPLESIKCNFKKNMNFYAMAKNQQTVWSYKKIIKNFLLLNQRSSKGLF